MKSIAGAFASRGHDVLYVDPPVSPLSVIRQAGRHRDLTGPSDTEETVGLRVWHPRVVPGQNSAGGQRINAGLLYRGLKRRLGAPDLTLVTSLEARRLVRHLQGRKAYFAIDSLEDLPGVDRPKMLERQRQMGDSVDVVLAASRPLRQQWEDRGFRSVQVTHGCDPEFFAYTGPAHPDLARCRAPVVGYVGSLNFRLDPNLLEAARQATRGGTLALIGGSLAGSGPSSEMAGLRSRADVVVLGHQPAATLPAYLKAMHVGLVPYRANDRFNQQSYPLKVLQYLAAGLPVVSTPNGATEDLGDQVFEAADPKGFRLAVTRALESDSDHQRAERRRVAMERPWTVVMGEIIEAMFT